MGAIDFDQIARRYQALCELVPLKPITKRAQYQAAVEHLNRLLDAGGANQGHPLEGLVEALGEMIQAYEKRQAPAPDASPRDRQAAGEKAGGPISRRRRGFSLAATAGDRGDIFANSTEISTLSTGRHEWPPRQAPANRPAAPRTRLASSRGRRG